MLINVVPRPSFQFRGKLGLKWSDWCLYLVKNTVLLLISFSFHIPVTVWFRGFFFVLFSMSPFGQLQRRSWSNINYNVPRKIPTQWHEIVLCKIVDCWVSLSGRQILTLMVDGWPDLPTQSIKIWQPGNETQQSLSVWHVWFYSLLIYSWVTKYEYWLCRCWANMRLSDSAELQ